MTLSPQEIVAQLGTGQRGIPDFPTTTADEWVSVSRLAFAQGRPDLVQGIYKHVAKIGELSYTAAKDCIDYFRGTEQVAIAVSVCERLKIIITRDAGGDAPPTHRLAAKNANANVNPDVEPVAPPPGRREIRLAIQRAEQYAKHGLDGDEFPGVEVVMPEPKLQDRDDESDAEEEDSEGEGDEEEDLDSVAGDRRSARRANGSQVRLSIYGSRVSAV
ncbi:hypothetical protein NCC49_002616 [Naganishia albida]|nr:hypothetical protein NCC49_002616 [Naganishia albida]